jgi:hypothetical protein
MPAGNSAAKNQRSDAERESWAPIFSREGVNDDEVEANGQGRYRCALHFIGFLACSTLLFLHLSSFLGHRAEGASTLGVSTSFELALISL